MARDLLEEAGVAPVRAETTAEGSSTEGRDLFKDAGIAPDFSQIRTLREPKKVSPAEKFVNELPEELFKKSHPTSQLMIGMAKPIAGALQWADIHEPARFLNRMSERFEEGTGGGAQVLDIAGQIASPTPTKVAKGFEYLGKGLEYIPKVSQYGTQLVRAGSKVADEFANLGTNLVGRYSPEVANLITKASDKAGAMLAKSPLAQASWQGAKASITNPLSLEEGETYGDFLSKKIGQIGEGTVAGGALGKLSQLALNPQVAKSVQELKDLGMRYFTPGQLASQVPMIGKLIQSIEAKATSIPLAGAFIEKGFKTAASDFNRALGNEVLKPMGEVLPKGVKAGEDLIQYLNKRVADAYDTITPKLQLSNVRYKDPTSPSGFTTTVKALNDKLADVTQGLPSAKGNNMAGMVREEFDKYILDPLTKLSAGKVMSGEEFRTAEKNLGRVAFNYMKDPKMYDVGVALRELQGELRRELSFQNPKIADELRGIHDAFIRHLPVERAASFIGAENRIFNPSQFQSAVKAETKGKGKFASGQSTFYPESQAALEVLGKTIPDSGTAGRLGTGALLTGGGYGIAGVPGALKALALPTIGAGLVYNKPVMGALTTLATERPDWMRKISPAIEKVTGTIGGLKGSRKEIEEGTPIDLENLPQ